jgi:hypothetical protein
MFAVGVWVRLESQAPSFKRTNEDKTRCLLRDIKVVTGRCTMVTQDEICGTEAHGYNVDFTSSGRAEACRRTWWL